MIKIIVLLSALTMFSLANKIIMSPENNQYLILWSYLAMSLITFAIYAFDKSASKNGRWRVPEKSLHTLSLIGGWPGAMIGQRVLRHKTVKQPFRFIFWLTVATNIAAVIWFIFPETAHNILSYVQF